jgi:hypothetical protein
MIDLDKIERAARNPWYCRSSQDDNFLIGTIVELITRLRQAEKDAARYRFLRGFHWSESPMCVVTDPSSAIKLGSNCPSMELLDAAIDEAMQCK